jgi:hypothetical protein
MLLAERPAPTGAFDFEALAEPAIGRVLRYAIVGTAAGRRVWQDEADEYALGFPSDYRNGDGGVDVGDNYDRNGEVIAGSCGGFVWMSGEDLRASRRTVTVIDVAVIAGGRQHFRPMRLLMRLTVRKDDRGLMSINAHDA